MSLLEIIRTPNAEDIRFHIKNEEGFIRRVMYKFKKMGHTVEDNVDFLNSGVQSSAFLIDKKYVLKVASSAGYSEKEDYEIYNKILKKKNNFKNLIHVYGIIHFFDKYQAVILEFLPHSAYTIFQSISKKRMNWVKKIIGTDNPNVNVSRVYVPIGRTAEEAIDLYGKIKPDDVKSQESALLLYYHDLFEIYESCCSTLDPKDTLVRTFKEFIEFIEGMDESDKFTDTEKLIIWDFINGIYELKTINIVPNDLHTGNMLLDKDGVLKIFDPTHS